MYMCLVLGRNDQQKKVNTRNEDKEERREKIRPRETVFGKKETETREVWENVPAKSALRPLYCF